MSDRGTSNSPNTRNAYRPASKPSRLEQFADNLFDSDAELSGELGVRPRRTARRSRLNRKKRKID